MAFQGDDVSPEKKTGYTYRGKEIILSKSRGRPVTGLVKMGMERGIYPDSKYIEVVGLFAATGNLTRVSELSKVPVETIRRWTKEVRFRELLKEIRDENNEKIDAKFTEIIEKAADLVLDRLEFGDFHWDSKNCEMVRKPVSAKDLSLVTAINLDKRQVIRKEPNQRIETINEPQRLEKLAEQFSKLANQFKNVPKLEPVIDVAFEEVKSEEDAS